MLFVPSLLFVTIHIDHVNVVILVSFVELNIVIQLVDAYESLSQFQCDYDVQLPIMMMYIVHI